VDKVQEWLRRAHRVLLWAQEPVWVWVQAWVLVLVLVWGVEQE
jgi:hypothetical protein